VKEAVGLLGCRFEEAGEAGCLLWQKEKSFFSCNVLRETAGDGERWLDLEAETTCGWMQYFLG
jgi:hypothetical protein